MTVLTGTAGNDPLYGGSGNDSLSGLAGDDSLYGGAGNDTLVGGDGNDYLSKHSDPGGSLLQGGAGQDSLLGGTQNDTLDGGDDDDPWLEGYAGNDSILGGAGNDRLTGDEGDDTLDGGAGSDTLSGGGGNDGLIGGDGNDELLDQSSGDDTLLGGAGDDKLLTYGSTGSDSLDGGDGNDTLMGGLGNDTLLGGDGNDSLSGQESHDSLDGGMGKDTLFGGDGNDILIGGDGNDELLDQSSGDDTLLGGVGDDMLSTYTSTGSDSLDGGDGNDTLTGGLGNDTLLGGDGNDSLSGQEGNDSLDGGAGNDTLYGGDGNDSLVGGPGNDSLYGSAGNDTLSGATGTDLLWGGDGDDVYKIASRDFELYDTGGNDTAIVSTSFVKLPPSIEIVSYANGALALPYWLDTLLGGDGAQFAALLGPAKTFFYVYPSALPAYVTDPAHALGYLPFTAQQIAFSVQAMAYVSSVIDLRFAETGTVSALNTIAFANNTQTDSAGYAFLPSGAALGSDVFLDRGDPDNLAPVDGSYAAGTVIHELGHAMGLKHPFQSDVNEAPYLPASEDITAWTLMSYTSDPAQYHAVYSPLDLAALQYLYGPSTTARTGDDSYTVSASADNFIWDGAGKDTLSAAALSQSVTLYLEPGYWGYVGSKSATITSAGQVTVNFGSVIENLLGGAGSDSLYGNAAANTITGGLGDDTLYGAAGDDTLDGGAGTDTVTYSGPRADYTITTIAGGFKVSGATEGGDTLLNAERLSFADGVVALSALDTIAPTVTSFSPADEAVAVAVDSNIVLSFSEAIAIGTGDIVLKTLAGVSVAIATSANLTISGSALTFNPTTDLQYGTDYSVVFSEGSVKDLAGNSFAGTTTYNFKTVAYVNNAPKGDVTITGTLTQGQTLTASNTLADVDGLGPISHQWRADGTSIASATSNTFVLTEAQVGKAVTVLASYTDGHGSAETVSSSATAAVANVNDAPTGVVTVSGVATQGQTLSATSSLADPDGLGAIKYQWQAAGVNISSANSSTFVLAEAQVGKAMTVVASYTDSHGTAEAVSSAATAAVVNVNDLPTGGVTIAGLATQGQTLTAANTLADIDGLGAIAYQWQAAGSNISGATGGSFVLTEAQVGKAITVVVKYTDGRGTAESVASPATAAVANVNDPPTGGVAITGTVTQGQTLTATNTLADIDGLGAVSYQWKADGTNVASGSTLVLAEAQVGKAITVAAGYTDGHGTVESANSTATIRVVNVNDPGSVFVNGTVVAGQTLTALAADADGLGPVSYQWFADGVVIGGATTGSLLVSAAQLGHTITVTAKYTDLHGTAELVSGGLGKAVDLLAYSWKAHTLLGAVDLSAAGHTASTSAGGTAGLTAGAGSSLDLTAARGVPSAEAAATSQAVNLQDAIAILKMIVGLDVNGAGKPLSPYQVYAADFDANGKVELSDAIAVLKHVVGLTSPDPQWIFFNETDSSVSSMLSPGKSSLNPGTVPASINVDLSAASPVPVGLVGVLRGDVDGSYAPAGNPLDLVSRAYFDTLLVGHPELSLSQFGVYP
jgi:Ca2+-binding RTX toxin-like protein